MNTILKIEIPASRTFIDSIRVRAKESDGEVVIIAHSSKNGIWLHTKSFYPPETYRLPTGRISPGEAPEAAFQREIFEEFGSPAQIKFKLGVLRYKFINGAEIAYFESHVFLAAELFEHPHPTSSEESISQFIETDINGLRLAAARLRSLPGDWHDWGAFRAPAHDFTADQLQAINNCANSTI